MSSSGASANAPWVSLATSGANPFLENGFGLAPGSLSSLAYRVAGQQLEFDGVVTCPAIASGASVVLCHLPSSLVSSLERWWGGSMYCDDNAAGRIFRVKIQNDGTVVLTLVGTAINAGALLTFSGVTTRAHA